MLEIGTGYHAALLCHRLGQRDVFSVDLHPDFGQLYLGSGRSSHRVINNTTKATVVAHDGSWAEATGGGLVTFDGTHNPWQTIETAHQAWTQLGQPQPCALGLTVTPDKHYVWCQHPDSDWTHPLT